MKAVVYISSFLCTLFILPLVWHSVMPDSYHWMSGEQIGGCVMGFIVFLIIAGASFEIINESEKQ